MVKRYELKNIGDLLNIPEDKFDEFLVDLKKWHKAARAARNMAGAIAEAAGEKLPANAITMVWIDDGKHEGKVVFVNKKKDKS